MLFGAIKNFDEITGVGTLTTEAGKGDLPFEKSAVHWGDARTPSTVAACLMSFGRTAKAQIAP